MSSPALVQSNVAPLAAIRFTAELGRALHRWGAPANQLEESMEAVARGLGLEGQFFVTPTAIYLSFATADGFQTVLLRSDSGDVDLVRLTELEALVRAVRAGEVTMDDAVQRLGRIERSRSRYGAGWVFPAYAVASAGTAMFFGGGWRELVLSASGALVVAGLSRAASRWSVWGRIFAPLAAFLVTALAAVAATWMAPVSTTIATLAGLIVLVPGLTVTIAFTELATRHLVSGVARLAGAVTTFLLIGLGVAFGEQVRLALGVTGAMPVPLPDWSMLVALMASPLAFVVLFQAPLRDAWAVAVAGWVAFAAARFGAIWWSPELGVFTGAFLVGVGANLFASWRGRPASILAVPGIMFLVPGSLGFAAVNSLRAQDVAAGLNAGFLMVMVGVALATGLVMANVVLPPRQRRRWH